MMESFLEVNSMTIRNWVEVVVIAVIIIVAVRFFMKRG